MTFRFTTSRAIGAAIALTLTTAATAAAQSTTGTTGSATGTATGTTADSTRRDSTISGATGGSMSGSTSGAHQGHHGATTTTTSNGTVSGSAATRGASRTRVRKDAGYETTTSGGEVSAPAPMTAAPAPAPEATPAPAPEQQPVVYSPPAEPAPAPVEAQPPMDGMRSTRFGNGVYLGLQAGANFPQNNINDFYDAGFNAGGQLGWDPTNSPLGLRLNVNYNRLNGRRDVLGTDAGGATLSRDLPNADLWAAFADAKLRLPFGRFLGATSGLYAVGGAGLTHFRNFQNFQTVTGINPGGSVVNLDPEGNRNVTRFALNGGGGLSWGLGNVSLFVEGRYVRVFTQDRDTDYVPVTIGLTIH